MPNIYEILFFLTPLVFLVLFGVCLARFLSAKKRQRQDPGSISPQEVRLRAVLLILSVIPVTFLLVCVIAVILMLFGAIAFM